MSKKRKSNPLVEVLNLKTGKLSKERISYEKIHTIQRTRSQLSSNQISKITKIYPFTGLLLDSTLSDWIKGFSYDIHPEREINIWEQMSHILMNYPNQDNLAPNEKRDVLLKLIDLSNGIQPNDRLSEELASLWQVLKKELGQTNSSALTFEEGSVTGKIDASPWGSIDHVKLAFAYQESTKSLELNLEEKDEVLVRLVHLMEGEEPQDFLGKKLKYILSRSTKDSNERVVSLVTRRKGQSKFRQNLIETYQGMCAITGCNEESVLEAAHIIRYADAGANHPSNGMLLRADIHTLFDKNLLSVNPRNYEVIVSPKLFGTIYDELDGRKIKLPNEDSTKPSMDALNRHYLMFLQKMEENPKTNGI